MFLSILSCRRVVVAAAGAMLTASAWGMPDQPELAVLPAAADAWRVTVSDGERHAELTGDSLVAGQLAVTVRGRDGVRDALTFDWKDRWEGVLRFESPQPVDLEAFVARGTLEFDLDVAELAHGGIRVKLSCGEGCEPAVNVFEQGRAWVGKGWQHVSVPIPCFAREGGDFSQVKLPFALVGLGSGRASVANVRLLRQGKPNTGCPDYRTESVTPAISDEWWSRDTWLPRHERKLQEKRALVAAGTPPELVFLGDSITEYWEGAGREIWRRHYARYHALNLGFAGDRTENVLWRLQHGEIDGIAPKVTVLMVGTNNVGFRAEDPQAVANGIRRIVDEIHRRLPGTRVLLLAIFPRGERPDDFLRGLNERVNRIVAGWSDVRFLDLGAAFLDPDGMLSKEVMPDLLHPSEKGYALWQRAMEPELQRLLQMSR